VGVDEKDVIVDRLSLGAPGSAFTVICDAVYGNVQECRGDAFQPLSCGLGAPLAVFCGAVALKGLVSREAFDGHFLVYACFYSDRRRLRCVIGWEGCWESAPYGRYARWGVPG